MCLCTPPPSNLCTQQMMHRLLGWRKWRISFDFSIWELCLHILHYGPLTNGRCSDCKLIHDHMHIRNGLRWTVTQKSVQQIHSAKENVLTSSKSKKIEHKSNIFKSGPREELFSECFQWLMKLDSLDEVNPTNKSCFVREHDVAKDHTCNYLELCMPWE